MKSKEIFKKFYKTFKTYSKLHSKKSKEVINLEIPEFPENTTFCQCCGMPLDEGSELKGTEADGSISDGYCIYCYKDGAFTAPDMTMEEMIEFCIPHVISFNTEMTEEDAREMMQKFFPELKRWKK